MRLHANARLSVKGRELLVGASLLGAATTIALLVALPGLRERGGRD